MLFGFFVRIFRLCEKILEGLDRLVRVRLVGVAEAAAFVTRRDRRRRRRRRQTSVEEKENNVDMDWHQLNEKLAFIKMKSHGFESHYCLRFS